MLSLDTNLLFHAFNTDSPFHGPSLGWLSPLHEREDIALSEFVLAEFHGLLRNPAVLSKPLGAADAVKVIESYRRHPRWRLIGFPADSRPFHDRLWQIASRDGFAFRRLYDVRIALTLLAQGVTEFATVNTKDFQGLGFKRVWNPLVP